MEEQIKKETSLHDNLAARLSEARKKASGNFSEQVQEMIRGLELQQAVFSVDITPAASA